ncbi:MAG TPA: DUF6178 family protein [Vicinamibacterales bacterium]|nr:DUF6178 family protein [Vicinamibacterales bacterium]
MPRPDRSRGALSHLRDRPADHLARLLDSPNLPELVARLAPESLHHLIRTNGLDACGPLVAAAAPEQITAVLDLDLWQTLPERDDVFDAERFGAWLEMLADIDAASAARLLTTLDRDLVIVGLSRHIRVCDPAIFLPTAPSDDEAATRVPDDLEAEICGYLVRGRDTDVWDAIVHLLLALEAEDADGLHALMRGCRALSNSTPEDDELDVLLLEPEQILHDAAISREDRRVQQGYVTANDARAFLELARHARPASPGAARPRNAIAAAYVHAPAVDPTAPTARAGELAFLVNTLAAGCSLYNRPMTVEEAGRAVVGACNLGIDIEGGSGGPGEAGLLDRAAYRNDLLRDRDLVALFETGWTYLYEGVSLYVARRLAAVLTHVRSVDATTERDLATLARALDRHIADGAPWRVQDTLDVVSTLDLPIWACLLGLLSECPVLPDVLPAVLEKRAAAVTATAFDCFATIDQVRQAQAFADTLEEALLR